MIVFIGASCQEAIPLCRTFHDVFPVLPFFEKKETTEEKFRSRSAYAPIGIVRKS